MNERKRIQTSPRRDDWVRTGGKPHGFGLTVQVQNDNVEQALRKLKKKIGNDGKLMTLREKQEFTPKTEIRKRAKAAAKSRWRKQMSREKLPPREY
jgi:ribosomal protein S21